MVGDVMEVILMNRNTKVLKLEIINLDLFVELMEDSRLAEEEKIELLQLVIKNNAFHYERKLIEKDTKVIEIFEHNQEEALEELEELNYLPHSFH